MSANQTIDNLYQQAQGSRGDPESLRQIAADLEWYGAWDRAAEVRAWAEQDERRYAEETWR